MPRSRSARWTRVGLLAFAWLALAAPAAAALYKWIDANGRTVYSDQPPPTNVKTELINGAPPPADPDAVKDMANREAEFRKRQMDRAEDAKKSDKSRAEAQKLATFCVQVRTQAAGLRRADIAMYRLNDKGERVELDEAARRAEADKLETLVRERKCPPA
jgi:hypothetical protein